MGLTTSRSSPYYVVPFIALCDIYVLRKLRTSQLRDFGEVILSYSLVLLPRIIAIFFGMLSRSYQEQPGAWEYVEPVLFLFGMALQGITLASDYWAYRDLASKSDIRQLVSDDRYNQWLAQQRELVSEQRARKDAVDAAHSEDPTLRWLVRGVGVTNCVEWARRIVLWINQKTQHDKRALKTGGQLDTWGVSKKLNAKAEKQLQKAVDLEVSFCIATLS